ncbi:MAG: HAD family hydrolase [Ruminiclostridium sp.]|nr:HAD family hydrolase [Ruminiclostridium sp.]
MKTKKIIDYGSYIFDLYGTLIEMRTDEESLPFWQKMAELYAVYGADYTAAGLRHEYKRLCKEEERKLIAEAGCRIPEIKLEKVFARLLSEAKHTHRTAHTFGAGTDEIAYYIANSFRVLSRHRMKLYPAVPELLQYLRDSGKGVYMLSNAQAVFTTPEIEQLDLAKYFDDIFLSSDIGVKKPEPLFFEKLLQKHALDPERTVMVGNDFYADMGIALACGTAGAHINSDKLSARERAKQRKMLETEYDRSTDKIYEFQSIRDLLNVVAAQQ